MQGEFGFMTSSQFGEAADNCRSRFGDASSCSSRISADSQARIASRNRRPADGSERETMTQAFVRTWPLPIATLQVSESASVCAASSRVSSLSSRQMCRTAPFVNTTVVHGGFRRKHLLGGADDV